MSSPPPMTAGVTPPGASVDGVIWNILGQTYRPLHRTDSSFSWNASFPPGTFVPPHVHHAQDEFIYVLSGRFDLLLDTSPAEAGAGALIHLPRGVPHGIFNNSPQEATSLFWVSPSGTLWDLFEKISNVPDPAEVVRLAAMHEVDFLPPASP
jgi:quercetin dioxygenase-like cupin family protein